MTQSTIRWAMSLINYVENDSYLQRASKKTKDEKKYNRYIQDVLIKVNVSLYVLYNSTPLNEAGPNLI